MRSRKEIRADFERTVPKRKEEQLAFQRQKLLLEATQNMDERICMLAKGLIKTIDDFLKEVRSS